MKLYLSTSSHTIRTREPYSDDSWDRGDTDTSWHFGGISLAKPVGEYEYIEVDDDFDVTGNIYLVLAVWSTGDSFGNDNGACCEIFAAYNIREDAERRRFCYRQQPMHLKKFIYQADTKSLLSLGLDTLNLLTISQS